MHNKKKCYLCPANPPAVGPYLTVLCFCEVASFSGVCQSPKMNITHSVLLIWVCVCACKRERERERERESYDGVLLSCLSRLIEFSSVEAIEP